ncbi:MAG: mannitol dehydrogenase family protein [Rhizobiaceae bacterium]
MDELIPICDATLGSLPSNVRIPRYNRNQLTAGIVHIGVGNFHRAHQAWYLHRLFEEGLEYEWAIIGAGVRDHDFVQREKLLAQDCLTTLVELAPAGISAEICGSMIGYAPVERGNVSLIAQMAEPAVRIISLTVTEGGYFADPTSGAFDRSHPDIVHDAANPETPRTAFGAIVAALKLRREHESGPFSVLSCDNLRGNGTVTRRTVVSLARMSDHGLADWIETHCSFPNSMVDCIVPATGAKAIELARGFGINDAVPVTHEDFRQWVIEDDFCAGRPDLSKAGVVFSNDVHAFEMMKLRILNGGHQIIAAAGDLLGFETIAEVMGSSSIRRLLDKVMVEEIIPHVSAVPGVTPEEYFKLIKRRFSNELIGDTTRRVAYDGSSRQPGFIVPSILDGLSSGVSVNGLALVSAIWARYCQGKREDGGTIEANDPNWSELKAVAERAKHNPVSWLEMGNYYGDISHHQGFADAFIMWLNNLNSKGLDGTISAYTDG